MTGRSALRGLFYAGGVILAAVLFLALPPPYSTLVFFALMGGSALYALRSAGKDEAARLRDEMAALLPRQTGRLLALAACGLMLFCAWIFSPGSHGEVTLGFGVMIVGILALGGALRLTGAPRPEFTLASSLAETVNRPVRWLIVAGGVAALGYLTAINANDCLDFQTCRWDVSQHWQMALFFGGIALLIWGLVGGWRGLQDGLVAGLVRESPLHGCRFRAWHTLALAGIILLALVVRLWNLETSIYRFVDEIHYAHAVASLRDEPAIRILRPFGDITSFSWLFPYLDYVWVSLLGPSLTSIRLASALIGTLNVLALYFLVRTLVDRKTALLAALFLATFPPHMHFSRLALNNIVDPLLGTLVFLFLALGLKTGRRIHWVLAGVCLGLTQYFYEGGRLLFPPLAVTWLVWVIVTRRRCPDTRRRPPVQWRRLALFVLVALVIAAPFYLTLTLRDLSLTPRMDDTTNLDWRQALIDHPGRLLDPFLLLVHQPDTFWFYGGETGLILPVLVPLFLLGIAHAVWRLREPGMALLLAWIAATALGNNLLSNTTDASRYVVVFPALAALLAIGLRCSARLVASSFNISPARTVGLNPLSRGTFPFRRIGRVVFSRQVMCLAVLALALAQVGYYFGSHLTILDRQVHPQHNVDGAMFWVVETLPPHTSICIITDEPLFYYNPSGIVRFWDREDDLTVQLFSPDEFARKVGSLSPGRYAFLVEAFDIPTHEVIQARFGMIDALLGPYDIPLDQQLVLYYVPDVR